MSDIFIHYGNTVYNPSLIGLRRNKCWIKPERSLWACREDAEFGWRDWAAGADFKYYSDENFFAFKLQHPEKLAVIEDEKSLLYFVKKYGAEIDGSAKRHVDYGMPIYLDFFAMRRDGWIGIEIKISNYSPLYWNFYGWDCDSAAIWNPDEVVFLYSGERGRENYSAYNDRRVERQSE